MTDRDRNIIETLREGNRELREQLADALARAERAEAALAVAREYANKISTIYVGPEEDERGRWFLAELARVSGGVAVTAARAVELGAGLERLLLRG